MSTEPLIIFEHPANPSWGRGTLIETRDGKAVLQFEHGGRKILVIRALGLLKGTDLSKEAAIALAARLRGRRVPGPVSAAKKKKAGAAVAAPAFASFEAQLASFDGLFPGGFLGERFIKDERGVAGPKGRSREAAIQLAQEGFTPARFAEASADEIFATVEVVVKRANLVHPQEGGIALASMSPEAKSAFVLGLKNLLHGTGEYGIRFQQFISDIHLNDSLGKPKRVTWPLATLLMAVYAPGEHVCVKPTSFISQAPIVGGELTYQIEPSARVYEQFLNIARATRDRLVAAGHAPRDLMDVYSFIWRTQSAKVPAAPVAVPAAS